MKIDRDTPSPHCTGIDSIDSRSDTSPWRSCDPERTIHCKVDEYNIQYCILHNRNLNCALFRKIMRLIHYKYKTCCIQIPHSSKRTHAFHPLTDPGRFSMSCCLRFHISLTRKWFFINSRLVGLRLVLMKSDVISAPDLICDATSPIPTGTITGIC